MPNKPRFTLPLKMSARQYKFLLGETMGICVYCGRVAHAVTPPDATHDHCFECGLDCVHGRDNLDETMIEIVPADNPDLFDGRDPVTVKCSKLSTDEIVDLAKKLDGFDEIKGEIDALKTHLPHDQYEAKIRVACKRLMRKNLEIPT